MVNERVSEDIVMKEARWSWHTLYPFGYDMQLIEQIYDKEYEVHLSLIHKDVNHVKWRTHLKRKSPVSGL